MRFILAVVAVSLLGAACSASSVDGEIVGIVTEVTGDLSGVESFVVRDQSGNSYKFIPSNEMTVSGSPPRSLRDHVVSGTTVRVIYHENSGGQLVAETVIDF